jgi:co-chaperonin GroES (HSP10)
MNETNQKNDSTNPIHHYFDNGQLIADGFPIMVSGDRVIIEEVENSHLTSQGILIVDTGGKDNSSRVAKIVAISPDLLNKNKHPDFFYKIGDLVYFNHLSGNYLRLRVPGRNELGRFFCLWITDILAKFTEPESYFANSVKEMEAVRLLRTTEIEDFKESASSMKNEEAIDLPPGIIID